MFWFVAGESTVLFKFKRRPDGDLVWGGRLKRFGLLLESR